MKKYLKLTTNEAIRHFLLPDNTLAPETTEEIRQKLGDLRELRDGLAVTIVIPTHRIAPDTKMDVIQLKNQVARVEKELYELSDKRHVWAIMENIKEAQQAIDNSINLDTLVLYANEQFSSVVKLPVDTPEPGIMIGRHFDVRPLLRAQQQNRRYYILTISQSKIRLMEALNDKLYLELEDENFPFVNNTYYTTDANKLAQDDFQENQLREYFNDADKLLQIYLQQNPLPLVLAGDVKAVSHFREQMDDSRLVIAQVAGNYDNHPAREVVETVVPVIQQFREAQQQEYLSQIDTAASGKLLITDIDEMFESLCLGNVQTLFVGEHYTLNGHFEESGFKQDKEPKEGLTTNDMLLTLLINTRRQGGDVIFVHDDLLGKYGGIVMAKRYASEDHMLPEEQTVPQQ